MKIAIVDDDEAVLDSLTALLKSFAMESRAYHSARAYLDDAGTGDFECLVTDIRMPDMSGIDLMLAHGKCAASVPVILITGHGDIEMAVSCLKQGAFDFIEKPFTDTRLIDSIKAAISGRERARSNEASRHLLAERLAELTARQREVMDLVVEGLSNKEIALKLGISPRTVENYRAWVMEKMEARNLADLVRMVLLYGGKP